jgi:hypothetical protein
MAPSVWKLLYSDLAGDNSTPPHELSKEMQERVRTILDLQDADIITVSGHVMFFLSDLLFY